MYQKDATKEPAPLHKKDALIALIKSTKSQFLPMDELMRFWLTDDRFGYYRKGNPLSRSGDFVTAPEISSLFGEMIGLWIAASALSEGAPHIALVEFGPGTGVLMQDVLRTLKKLTQPDFVKEVHLLEINRTLIQEQQAKLDSIGSNLFHHSSLDTCLNSLPKGSSIYIFSNEYFDALASKEYCLKDGELLERGVSLNARGQLQFYPQAENNTLLERSPVREHQFSQVLHFLEKYTAPARFLTIDYGYVRAEFGSSLQAMKDGKYSALLESDLQGDLTTHVDFAALYAQTHGHKKLSRALCSQRHFLLSLGLELRAKKASFDAPQHSLNKTVTTARDILTSYERLVSPKEMGTLFKALQVSNIPNDPYLIQEYKSQDLRSSYDLL